MLKALIIDDEMYVRRQMRVIIEWAAYGIEIVGDAENGRLALDFMRRNPVDLVFTDLEMPGLSGMAFLQALHDGFPEVRIVVLTMHQEFDLIQQAMRLGVDDYIAKAQITKESFAPMLRDIIQRIQSLPGQRRVYTPEVECLYFPVPQPYHAQQENRRLNEHFFLHSGGEPIPKGAVAIRASGLAGERYRVLLDVLRQFVDVELFYAYSPMRRQYAFVSAEMAAQPSETALGTRAELRRMMGEPSWLADTETFARLLALTPKAAMPRQTLISFFFSYLLRLTPLLSLEAEQYFAETEGFAWWHDWKAWLTTQHNRLRAAMEPEDAAMHGISRALLYIDQNYQTPLPLQDVLAEAALSKSHFSQLFKKRTGVSFVEYVKALRVERAKQLLRETNWPLGRIIEQVGYTDEKYFRRVFQSVTGRSLSAYRKKIVNVNKKG